MKGNNKRLSNTIPGDAYLTPRWAVFRKDYDGYPTLKIRGV